MALQKALKFHESGHLDAAQALYEQVLRQQPKHFDALHLLGALWHQKGDHKRAIELIRQAIDLYARNPLFYVNLANALTEIGEYPEALRHYERALKLAPGHPEIELSRAAALVDVGAFDEATKIIQAQLNRDPDNANAWFNLGLAQAKTYRYKLAIESLTRCLHIDGRNTKAMYELAANYVYTDEFQSAVVVLDILLGVSPDDDRAWALRGVAFEHLNLFDEALESLRRAYKTNRETISELISISLQTLYWDRLAELKSDLSKLIHEDLACRTQFFMMALQTSAQEQYKTFTQASKVHYPAHAFQHTFDHQHAKIRVAYVSGDFKQHPVSYLTAELFELHDKERFEIIGVNINGKAAHDEMTERVHDHGRASASR
ncbi:MAG: tetratricopeptide repeat protein [Alphaproteobacteria bacterium]|nr:tetratricopeptide repeat protein [Alphaproteobacteria bacterium]